MKRTVLLILAMAFALAAQPSADQRLSDLLAREWERGLKESPESASYLGDKRYNRQWDDVSLDAVARQHQHRIETLRELNQIPRDQLSAAQRLNYDLFRWQLEMQVQGYQYGWHLVPLTMREGIQTADQLGSVLQFQSRQDFEDWIARLRALPTAVDQTIALMREGIRRGLVQPKVIMQRIPGQLEHQIVSDETESPFYKPFRSMPESLSAADQETLRADAREAINRSVVPAYRRFLKFFTEEYLAAAPEAIGMSHWPDGAAHYAHRAKLFTTTDLTPREIHDIGMAEVGRIRREMEQVMRAAGWTKSFEEFLTYLRTSPEFYYTDPQELMTAYRALAKRIDPTLPKLFGKLPRIPYGVEAIPAAIAPDTTTAYYQPPSADGRRAGMYFVNLYKPEVRPRYEMEALSLHEAVPGHHLQLALSTELTDLPPFRRFSRFTAFVEGWGLYAESLGEELGFYQDPYSKFGQLTYDMWRAVRLVVDTGMHALGWSRQQAIDFFLANAAKTEQDVVNEIDRYIGWPGQALAYKIGQLKIRELRTRAEATLGDRFDVRTFHDAVLAQGPLPLAVLESHMMEWIAAQQAAGK